MLQGRYTMRFAGWRMPVKLISKQNITGSIHRRHRRERLLAFIAIIIAFIFIGLYGSNYTSIPVNEGKLSDGSVILSANTVISLAPGHYTSIEFLLPTGLWNLNGAVTSSTYVTIYILNMTQYNNLKDSRPFAPTYFAFADSGAFLNVTLTSGNYYLVFYNHNSQWGVGVEAITNIVVIRIGM